MAEPVDLSPIHRELDAVKRVICHCQLQGECLGCKGIEMVRQQLEAVVAAASQPVLLQVAQETAAREMLTQFAQMQERLMDDPQMRQAADAVRQRLMEDPEARRMIEELMNRLGQGGEPGQGQPE
jgi:uncharacterized membrane-anchored protein YjiN (DUF445 family)